MFDSVAGNFRAYSPALQGRVESADRPGRDGVASGGNFDCHRRSQARVRRKRFREAVNMPLSGQGAGHAVKSRVAVAIFALGVLGGMAPPVVAQTEYGHYGPGAGGQMKMAALPPPGLVVENGTLIFNTRKFVDGNGTSTDATGNAVANRTTFIWTSERTILGGRYQAAFVAPFANFAAPRATPDSDTTVGIADLVLQPFGIGWQRGSIHAVTNYTLFTPTGRFTFGRNDNRG